MRAPSAPPPPLDASLLVPTNWEDSVKASPTLWLASLEPAKDSVTRPPTSLPKSRVTAAPLPDSRVDRPVSRLAGLVTVPLVAKTERGVSVREVGERLSAAHGLAAAAFGAAAARVWEWVVAAPVKARARVAASTARGTRVMGLLLLCRSFPDAMEVLECGCRCGLCAWADSRSGLPRACAAAAREAGRP